MYKFSVLAELYKLKLINKKLLFELSEALETSFQSKHLKKTEIKLGIIKCLPPIFHMEAVDKYLHSRKISDNSLFKGMDDYIIKELLTHSTRLTVPSGEFIYQAKQPADSSRL